MNNEISRDANDSVTFAGGAITITGDGKAARNENNQPEAWFDKNEPVTLNFIHLGSGVRKSPESCPCNSLWRWEMSSIALRLWPARALLCRSPGRGARCPENRVQKHVFDAGIFARFGLSFARFSTNSAH